jgi:hypothetical protein
MQMLIQSFATHSSCASILAAFIAETLLKLLYPGSFVTFVRCHFSSPPFARYSP